MKFFTWLVRVLKRILYGRQTERRHTVAYQRRPDYLRYIEVA
jgi:hypothetical protein